MVSQGCPVHYFSGVPSPFLEYSDARRLSVTPKKKQTHGYFMCPKVCG